MDPQSSPVRSGPLGLGRAGGDKDAADERGRREEKRERAAGRQAGRQAGSRCELAAAGLSNNSTPNNDIKRAER
jgi:hypothetical protein